jgi:hypothetical protein
MTKSLIKLDDNKFLIEINKRGINAIMVNNEIKVGDFDGVEFIEKDVKEKDKEFINDIVSKMRKLLENCKFVKSIVLSDLIYVKFNMGELDVIAFVSEDSITFNEEIKLSSDLIESIRNCAKAFKDIVIKG